MNPIKRLFERRSISYQDIWGKGGSFTTLSTTAGKVVSPQGSLSSTTVGACARLISFDISTLPVDSFIRDSDGRRQPFPQPDWMSFTIGADNRMDIIVQIMLSLLLEGNAYLATYRDATGRIIYLEPLDPRLVYPTRIDGVTTYTVAPTRENNVSSLGNVTELSAFDVLHIKGMVLPGEIEGISPIRFAKETIGLELAATEFGASFFGNGAMPSLVAETPGEMTPNGIKAMRENWQEVHGGSGNANKLGVFTNGAKLSKLSVAPDDAQFLETRKFQVEDIARIFGVPTSLLQHSGGPEMGNSLSDKNTQFAQHTLRAWVERLELAFSWLMHSEGLPTTSFVKFNLDGLMRGDFASRFEVYNKSVVQGILTINEVRAFEDMPPVEWGDEPISVQVQDDELEDDEPEEDLDTEQEDDDEV